MILSIIPADGHFVSYFLSYSSKKFTTTLEMQPLFQKSFPTVANTRFWGDIAMC